MNRLAEIQKRLSEIASVLEKNEANTDVEALTKETDALIAERSKIEADAQQRQALRSKIANAAISTINGAHVVEQKHDEKVNEREARAKAFVQSRQMTVSDKETRALLVSSGTLIIPTETGENNELPGARYSSILDLVRVKSLKGVGSDRVGYKTAHMTAKSGVTEGASIAGNASVPSYAYVDITPTTIVAFGQISKKLKNESPIDYEADVRNEAMDALKDEAVSLINAKLKASALVTTLNAEVDTKKNGVINEKTLRNLTLNYFNGKPAWLFLNHTDLIAFGDVRGTNEKKAVYEIIPDSNNQNTGIIKDGGLSVHYCIDDGLTALAGTAQASSAVKTMFYGDPQAIKFDLFSDYEIEVSNDFAFDKLMDTIRGNVDAGTDVVVKGAFVTLAIPANA